MPLSSDQDGNSRIPLTTLSYLLQKGVSSSCQSSLPLDPTVPHSHVPTAAFLPLCRHCKHKHPGSMHECVCACKCVHISINMYESACAFVHRWACLYACVLLYGCMLICTRVCTAVQARGYMCMNSFGCICMCVPMGRPPFAQACTCATGPLGLHDTDAFFSIMALILSLHSKVRSSSSG